jgi:hypothetical protein
MGGRIGGRDPCKRVATSKISGNRWKSLEMAKSFGDSFSQRHRTVDLNIGVYWAHSKYPGFGFICP